MVGMLSYYDTAENVTHTHTHTHTHARTHGTHTHTHKNTHKTRTHTRGRLVQKLHQLWTKGDKIF